MVALSITGLFRTLLIIVGAFVVLRFLGQLMLAKRAAAEQKDREEQQRRFEKERSEQQRNLGRTKIVNQGNVQGTIQDIDFEEID